MYISHKISHDKFVIYQDSYLQAMLIDNRRLNITSTNESTGRGRTTANYFMLRSQVGIIIRTGCKEP